MGLKGKPEKKSRKKAASSRKNLKRALEARKRINAVIDMNSVKGIVIVVEDGKVTSIEKFDI